MKRTFVTLCILVLGAIALSAQQQPNNVQGIDYFASYQAGNVDLVGLSSGSVMIKIPIGAAPGQRGGKLDTQLSLYINSKSFAVEDLCDPDGADCYYAWVWQSPPAQLYFDSGFIAGEVTPVMYGTCDWDGYTLGVQVGNTVQTGDGATHSIAPNYVLWPGGVSSCSMAMGPGYSEDGSGIYWTGSATGDSNQLFDNKGNQGGLEGQSDGLLIYEGSLQDSNGNQVSGGNDTLGRPVPSPTTSTESSVCPSGLPLPFAGALLYKLPAVGDSAGSYSESYTLCLGSITINTNFGSNPYYTYGGAGSAAMPSALDIYSGSAAVPQMLILPNGKSWAFKYSSPDTSGYNYGDLVEVDLPLGGSINYTWQTLYYPEPDFTYASRWLASRAVNANDGNGPQTTSYAYSWDSSGNATTTVTDPLLNDTVHVGAAYLEGTGDSPASVTIMTRETQTRWYQGTGSSRELLKTLNTSYGSFCGPTEAAYDCPVLPTSSTTIWPNGQEMQVQHDWDNLGFGRVTAERVYDYGPGAPGPLLKTTTTHYADEESSSYLNSNLIGLPWCVSVQDGSGNLLAYTQNGYDAASLSSSGASQLTTVSTPRGNLTSITRWVQGGTFSGTAACSLSGGTALTSQSTFYDSGMPATSQDPATNTTIFSYSPAYDYGYLTETQYPTTSGVEHIVQGTYDLATGLLTSSTDQNSQETTYNYSDSLNRLTTTYYPDGGSTTYSYTDTPGALALETERKIDTTPRWTDAHAYFDGLGRPIVSVAANDETGSGTEPLDRVDTCYDADGRVSFKSYPYQDDLSSPAPNCSGVGDAFQYDALARPTLTTHSDSSTIITSYAGRAAKVQDEGNGSSRVTHVSQTDGLGHLVAICEVTGTTGAGSNSAPSDCGGQVADLGSPFPSGLTFDTSATGFATAYAYSALGNLLQVEQPGLANRTFTYDGLSRLLTAANPESGTTTYTYDNDSNVQTRTRPKPNQTGSDTVTATYGYDALNRVAGVSYSDSTPGFEMAYDESSREGVPLANGVGRLTYEERGLGGSAYTEQLFSYDPMGRVTHNGGCTPLECASDTGYDYFYTYDYLGDTTDTYSNYGYDEITTPVTAANYRFNTYLTSTYNRAGRQTSISSNWTDADHAEGALAASIAHNAFGEPLTAAMGDGVPETRTYDGRGRVLSIQSAYGGTTLYEFAIPSSGGYAPNGDLLSSHDTVNSDWSYTYDDLNRLSTSSGPNSFSYGYDRYGNRWSQNVTSGTGPAPSFSFDNHNRIASGASYDAAGNVTADGSHTYVYDDENRLVSIDSGAATYSYDAEGRRVEAVVGSAVREYPPVLNGQEEIVLDGDLNLLNAELYSEGRHAATYANGTVFFNSSDPLGTLRWNEAQACTSLPFGDALNCTPNESITDPSPNHFTGKPRDPETGNDYFGARYYSSSQSRFMSPDWSATPEAVPYANPNNPQTLNLYAYAGNNPVTGVDADGHICWTRACVGNFLEGIAAGVADAVNEFAAMDKEHGGSAKPVSPPAATGASADAQVWGKLAGVAAAIVFTAADAAVAGASEAPVAEGAGTTAADVTPANAQTITVLGSGKDVAPYVGQPGFNTFTGAGIPAADLDAQNALWLNNAIQRGDQIWLVTDPQAHAALLQSLPGQPQSAYLSLELPMLNQYSGVNTVPIYVTGTAH